MTLMQSFGLVMWYVAVALPFLTLIVLFCWGFCRTASVLEEGRHRADDYGFRLWTGIAMTFWSAVIFATLVVWWVYSGVDLTTYSTWRNSARSAPVPVQVEDAR